MNTPTYLLRFDDICPTMDWPVWESIEAILLEEQIQPIVAVIPDNQDCKFHICPPAADFWRRVRTWQRHGWTIALHGYQHTYLTPNAGILRIMPQSEFAGVLAREQERRLRTALDIFRREGITSDIWVAPSHSFDRTTLTLLKELGFNIICDGFARYPFHSRDGLFWLPVQLWRFQPMPAGVWTVCNHHNTWDRDILKQFHDDVKRYRQYFSCLDDIRDRFSQRRHGISDVLAAGGMRGIMRLKKIYRVLRPSR